MAKQAIPSKVDATSTRPTRFQSCRETESRTTAETQAEKTEQKTKNVMAIEETPNTERAANSAIQLTDQGKSSIKVETNKTEKQNNGANTKPEPPTKRTSLDPTRA
jgi:hypothetical protein